MNALRQPALRYPCHAYIAKAAEVYADASVAHTLTYPGWDKERARERIRVGRYGQEWLRAFCIIDGVPCQADDTDEKTPDKFDLVIGGLVVDVKTSHHPTLWPQAGAHLQGKAEIYVFLRCDERMRWSQFCGWLPSSGVFDIKNFVGIGKPLPGSDHLKQRFPEGSYFVSEDDLLSDHQFLAALKDRQVMASFLTSAKTGLPEDRQLSIRETEVERWARTGRIYG